MFHSSFGFVEDFTLVYIIRFVKPNKKVVTLYYCSHYRLDFNEQMVQCESSKSSSIIIIRFDVTWKRSK